MAYPPLVITRPCRVLAVLCCVVNVRVVLCCKHVMSGRVVNASCRVKRGSEGGEWVVVWWVRTKDTFPTRF